MIDGQFNLADPSGEDRTGSSAPNSGRGKQKRAWRRVVRFLLSRVDIQITVVATATVAVTATVAIPILMKPDGPTKNSVSEADRGGSSGMSFPANLSPSASTTSSRPDGVVASPTEDHPTQGGGASPVRPAIGPTGNSAPPVNPTPYGPDTCQQGYVWREAFGTDHVCVTPGIRSQAADDNARAASRWTSGSYGPDTCLTGYVWREASPTDHVCVLPGTRSQAAADNAHATERLAVAPKRCRAGYVWREAFPTDYVCVAPGTRSGAQYDNSQANARRNPTGPYGVTTCVQGYVWREARPVDRVCVTPDVRSLTAADNAAAASRTT